MSPDAESSKIRFVSAGAGTGKTSRLAQLLQEMLLAGHVNPGGVIATTFTNKAAVELRERVRSHLLRNGEAKLAVGIGQAYIGTVNSVCGALLVRFAFEARLPTIQRVLDPQTAQQILQQSVDEVIEEGALEQLMRVAHRLALDEPRHGQREEPWRTALREIVDQARANAIAPEALRAFGGINADRLLRHFPTTAEGNLDDLLAAAVERARRDIRAALASGAKRTKTTEKYLQCLDDAERDLRTGGMPWAKWNKLANEEPAAAQKAAAQEVRRLAAMHAAHRQLHADLREYLTTIFSLAAGALDHFAARKREIGAVDFADQERLLLDVLDHEEVASALREDLDLVMVDEFQDTSPIQLALFLKLARLAKHVVWVGDIKQAIYGFRGGDAALMQSVLASLPELGAEKEVLRQSYRSRPPLVALVNDVFATAFEGVDASQVTLDAVRSDLESPIAVEDWWLEGNNTQARCEAVASGIAALMAERVEVMDRITGAARPVRMADIAVLARTNPAVQELAGVLRARNIPSSTSQPGLLAQPEIVLAFACLRRLNDERDTLASAEIVSLAHCEDPEEWLTHRLRWIDERGEASAWREAGAGASPLLAAILTLRIERPLLSPREAVERVLEECGLARRVMQWQQSVGRARVRLANLDQLLGYASQYEEDSRAGGRAATLSGFLLWLQSLAAEGLDALPQPAVDAVQVMTYHAAKGLEWPVVVLLDLESDIKDWIWDQVRPESQGSFDAMAPLAGRFLRYWPWPYGGQKKVPIVQAVSGSTEGARIRAAALEEYKRLLYVSFTRARDLLVMARKEKSPEGEWMQTVDLPRWLSVGDDEAIPLRGGGTVGFRRRRLNEGSAQISATVTTGDLTWFEVPQTTRAKPPLLVSPSVAEASDYRIVERCSIGARIRTETEDRAALGEALHACIAADLVTEEGLAAAEVAHILERMDMSAAVAPTDVVQQLAALRRWLRERWPGAQRLVEVPVTQVLPNGQQLAGRIDLLLRTEAGWILVDHKSSPQGSGQWEELAKKHGGQLAAYAAAVEAVTGRQVLESWLVLAVSGIGLKVAPEPR